MWQGLCVWQSVSVWQGVSLLSFGNIFPQRMDNVLSYKPMHFLYQDHVGVCAAELVFIHVDQ